MQGHAVQEGSRQRPWVQPLNAAEMQAVGKGDVPEPFCYNWEGNICNWLDIPNCPINAYDVIA